MKVSIAIPVYEMGGRGTEFLKYCLRSILLQTHPVYEIVISDHSKNDDILDLCSPWPPNVKYVRNKENYGVFASNMNNCFSYCTGDIIKIMHQDDFFYRMDSLSKIVNNFDLDKGWLLTTYYHSRNGKDLFKLHTPSIKECPLFINKIGAPTCLTIKNEDILYFDENLKWYVDSDYYVRLLTKYGLPVILEKPTVVQRLWEGQVTNTIIHKDVITEEILYLYKKHDVKLEDLTEIIGRLGYCEAYED